MQYNTKASRAAHLHSGTRQTKTKRSVNPIELRTAISNTNISALLLKI